MAFWRINLILGVAVLATFPMVLLDYQTFIARDFGVFGFPFAHYLKDSWLQGEMPLWDPYSLCGIPFLAQWNTLSLYPGSILFLVFPLPGSLTVFCLLHLWLGGLGMHRLARHWLGASDFAAAAAGLVYAFNGFTLSCLVWPHYLAAIGWAPWLLHALTGIGKGTRNNLALAAMAGAMQMLTGAPELILITWFFAGISVVWDNLKSPKSPLKTIGQFLLAALFSAGLAAVQLLPFFQLLLDSDRSSTLTDDRWPMPVAGLANFLVPLFQCFSRQTGIYVQYDQQFVPSYYLGICVPALAILALWRGSGRPAWLLGLLSIISLVLALGNQGCIYPLLAKFLPFLKTMRFPVKFLFLLVLAAPLLAAMALNCVPFPSPAANQKERRSFFFIWLGFIALIFLICGAAYFYPRYQPPYHDWRVTWHSAAWAALWLSLGLGSFYGWKAGLAKSPPAIPFFFQAAILAVLWLDVYSHMPGMNPTASGQVFAPGIPTLNPKPALGTSRAMMSPQAHLELWQNSVTDPKTNLICDRLALNGNLNLLEQIPKVDGFFALNIRESKEVQDLLYATNAPRFPALEQFLGVCHSTTPGQLFRWTPSTNFSPWITGGQKPVFVSQATSLRWLADPTRDFTREVSLPENLTGLVQAKATTPVQITRRQIQAHRLEAEVACATNAMIVIAQCYYPAWKAYVDGHHVPLWRANHAYQALEVPAGVHQLLLRYEDANFRLGTAISLATLTVLSLAWLLGRSRGQPDRKKESQGLAAGA
jgi:hypothetical protein